MFLHKHLGAIEVDAIYDQSLKDMNVKKRKPCIKWTDEERYDVQNYASQHGIAATVRHYQSKYKNLNESIVRGFKNPIEKELKIATKNKSDPPEKLPMQVQGRPLMVGDEINPKSSPLRQASGQTWRRYLKKYCDF